MIKSKELAGLYVEAGNKCVFAIAEAILSKHLPRTKPFGKCFDVPSKNRPAFKADLQNAAAYGVELTDAGLVIKTSGEAAG